MHGHENDAGYVAERQKSCKMPMKDMVMNQFHIFQDPSPIVSTENLMASKDRLIDSIVQKLHKEFFPETVKMKSTAGRVWMDEQPDTGKDVVIDVDENDGGEGLRRSTWKRPEKDVFDTSKDTTKPRLTRTKSLQTGNKSFYFYKKSRDTASKPLKFRQR